jgi:5-methylcytosine-specific restriction endonuclease McrA
VKRKKGLAYESDTHRAFREELRANTPVVLERSHGICEVCGHERVEVIHHRLRRSQGGGNDLENLLGLGRGCHDEIHDNPSWAFEHGYLLRRHEVFPDGRPPYTV